MGKVLKRYLFRQKTDTFCKNLVKRTSYKANITFSKKEVKNGY